MNRVDTEATKKLPLWARSPFIEFEGLQLQQKDSKFGQIDQKNQPLDFRANSVEYTENMTSPRVIKSHFPFEMLPPNLLDTCKVIFVGRTPKDCCVSYYNHYLTIPDYKFEGTFDDFADQFLEGTLEFGNYWTMLKVI